MDFLTIEELLKQLGEHVYKIYIMRKEIKTMKTKIISVPCIALAFAGCMLCDATDEVSSAK